MNVRDALGYIVVLAVFFAAFPAIRPLKMNISISDFCFLVAAIGYLFLGLRLWLPKGLSTTIAMWLISAIVFLISFAISSLLSHDVNRAGSILMQYGFTLLIIPAIFIFQTQISIERLLKIFVFGVVIVSASGIIMHHFLPQIAPAYMVGGRMGSFFENPNRLSKMIALILPLLVYLLHTSNSRIGRLFLVFALFIVFYALLLSASFGGLFLSMGAISLMVLLMGSLRYVGYLVVISAVGGFLYLWSRIPLPDIFQSRVVSGLQAEGTSELGSLDVKKLLALEAWRVIQENPIIGIGADSFRNISHTGGPVHNTYLLIWSEGGIFALLAWVGFLLILLYGGIQVWLRTPLRAEGALAITAIVTLSVGAATNTHMYGRFWFVPIYLCFLLAYNHRRVETLQRHSVVQSS